MSDASLSLTGFDMAGLDRLATPAAEPRVRLRPLGGAALEQGRSRLAVTAAMFALAFGAVAMKLVDATLLATGAEPRVSRAAPASVPQARADIVDRNGMLLATSLATSSLYADPLLVIDPEEAVDRLSTVLPDLDRVGLLSELSSDRRFVWVRRNLSPRQEYEVNRLGLPGFAFQQEERRIYPQGPLAAHVVGFTGVDNNGLMGIEQSFDRHLKSGQGAVQLSIDIRLQHVLKQEIQTAIDAFSAIGGAGMVMDVRTGELLAMVSLPDFDPHNPANLPDDTRFNRNTLGVYEMGSTFKIFNSAMGLEAGVVDLDVSVDATRPIRIGRHQISDFKPKARWMTVAEVFQHSSNIGSVRIAERIGPAGQRDFMEKLGFLRPVRLELPELGMPMAPTPWREINMMTISFGHGLAVSPVHLVTATGAVVNGGVFRDATLLKRDRGEESPAARVISPQTSADVRKLMRLVVAGGTAKAAEAQGYVVGGKTGTAEKAAAHGYSTKARLSSFIGAFPMHDPRYIVFVMVDEPKGTRETFGYATGGWVAAPVVGRVVSRIGPLLGVKPVDETAPAILDALRIGPPPEVPGTTVAGFGGGAVVQTAATR